MDGLPKRKNLRLDAACYAEGGYFFITICLNPRQCILGRVVDGRIELSPIGSLVLEEINAMPLFHDRTEIMGAMIMPDHVHFIMRYHGERTHFGRVIGSMKSAVTRRLGYRIWQRNYFERAIRSEAEMQDKLRYMYDNPLRWELKYKG